MAELSTRRSQLTSTLLAALVAAAVLLPLLGHKPLTDWDEGIYAEVSREMLTRGWLVPHWNMEPWFEKPPLMLWITALFFRVFGVTEFWARAGSAFSGIALIAIAHAWTLRAKGMLAAQIGTLMLLGTFGFLHAARVGEMDVLLSLTCFVSIIGIERVTGGRSGGWMLFWAGFGFATMTKGAASIVLPLTAVLCLLTQRGHRRRTGRDFAAGLFLFLLIVAPWHLFMFHRFGTPFVQEYFGLHVWSRATRQIEGHTSHWWYYLKVLLVSAPPFCLLYPVAIASALRDLRIRVFAVFALVVLLFYSIVQTRLPHYIVPAYPAFTIVAATWVAERLTDLRARRLPHTFWIRLTAGIAMLSAASILLTTGGRRSLHTAKLRDGTTLAGNANATALLRHAAAALTSIPGALLVWREGHPPISTDVFYARRKVHQVELSAPPPGAQLNRYIFDPVPLEKAATLQPKLLLMDQDLVGKLPDDIRFSPIRQEHGVALGWVFRIPVSR